MPVASLLKEGSCDLIRLGMSPGMDLLQLDWPASDVWSDLILLQHGAAGLFLASWCTDLPSGATNINTLRFELLLGNRF